MATVTEYPSWKLLQTHAREIRARDLVSLFDSEAGREQRMSCCAAGITLDYSRNLIAATGLDHLLTLAAEAGVMDAARGMVSGERVNVSEGRAALHVALRDVDGALKPAPPAEALDVARQQCERVLAFADAVRSGAVAAPDGQVYTDIVSIGIGGSHLGPETALHALAANTTAPRVHFISNVDPAQSARVLAGLDPARTLVVLISKTFTTQETLANARAVLEWLRDAGIAEPLSQFAAVTASVAEAQAYGIAAKRIFDFADWVGGRYSLWSSVGLPLAIAIGAKAFRELLAGAHAMDRHFLEAAPDSNMPLLLGLLDIWYADFLGDATRAVVPYSDRLRLLPAYLQQLMMESNGKAVRTDGLPSDCATSPVIWGGVGTDGQHAFFQLLHQGTARVPVDLVVPMACEPGQRERHDMLVANAFAQAEALMHGRDRAATEAQLREAGMDEPTIAAMAPQQTFPGNRPSNMLLLERVDAMTFGALLALFEHRVFVQAAVWGINPFDQMGVELGKRLAGSILAAIQGRGELPEDPVTRALIARYQKP